jgi:hypothetical protein
MDIRADIREISRQHTTKPATAAGNQHPSSRKIHAGCHPVSPR